MEQMTDQTKTSFSKLAYLREIAGADLSHSQYRVLLAVFNYTDARGENAYPGNERIAEDTNQDPRTVSRALAVLRENGWLIQDRRGSGRSGKASKYRLAVPASHGSLHDTCVTYRESDTGHTGTAYMTNQSLIHDTRVTPSDQRSDQLTDGPTTGHHADQRRTTQVSSTGEEDCSVEEEQSDVAPPLLRAGKLLRTSTGEDVPTHSPNDWTPVPDGWQEQFPGGPLRERQKIGFYFENPNEDPFLNSDGVPVREAVADGWSPEGSAGPYDPFALYEVAPYYLAGAFELACEKAESFSRREGRTIDPFAGVR